MKRIDIRDVPKEIKHVVTFQNTKYPKVHLSYQKAGFGSKRFFICPHCGERREYLYIVQNTLACRNCLTISPYWGIQNTTKGGHTYIEYKMNKLARKYGIKIKYPFSYYQLLLDKPKNMHYATWERVARQLQILENMRNQAIFYNSFLEPSEITYVLKHCLYYFDLCTLNDRFISWKAVMQNSKSL